MGRCRSIVLVSVMLAAANAGGVLAAPPEEYHHCRDGSRQLDARIGQCTRAIQSGLLATHELADALRSRAAIYNTKQQYGPAIADYSEAIKLAPDNGRTYVSRGIIHLNLRRFDEAIEDFDRALFINPSNEFALNSRGNAYRGQKKFDLALADYNKALEVSPRFSAAFNNRGNLFKDQNDHTRAIADYEAAIALAPNDYHAFANRATVYELTGRPELAAKDYRVAYEKGANEAFVQTKLREYGLPMWRGTPSTEIMVPLTIVLVRGLTTTKGGVDMTNAISPVNVSEQLLPDLDAIWSQARIKWNVSVVERSIDDPTLIELLTTPLTETQRGMPNDELVKKRLGLRRLRDHIAAPGRFTVAVLPFIGSDIWDVNYGNQKVGFVGVWSDSSADDAPPRALSLTEVRPYKHGSLAQSIAASLGMMLGAGKHKCEAQCLVAGAKGRGYHLTREQITAARAAAAPPNN